MSKPYYYIATYDSERFVERSPSRHSPILGYDPFERVRSVHYPTFESREEAEAFLDRIGRCVGSYRCEITITD